MKVTCHICQEEDDDGNCARILVAGETFYVHDECGLEAIEEARAQKEAEVVPADLTDSEFLLDLAEKLLHVPVALVGTDQSHAERCKLIAKTLQNTKAQLEELLVSLREYAAQLNQKGV